MLVCLFLSFKVRVCYLNRVMLGLDSQSRSHGSRCLLYIESGSCVLSRFALHSSSSSSSCPCFHVFSFSSQPCISSFSPASCSSPSSQPYPPNAVVHIISHVQQVSPAFSLPPRPPKTSLEHANRFNLTPLTRLHSPLLP